MENAMEWIENAHMKEDLKNYALTAMNSLKSIANECDLVRANVPYLQKKVAMVWLMTDAIKRMVSTEKEEVTA